MREGGKLLPVSVRYGENSDETVGRCLVACALIGYAMPIND